MIADARLTFATNVTLPATTPAIAPYDVLLSSVRRDIGEGQPLYVVIDIPTAPSGGGGDVIFQFQIGIGAAAGTVSDALAASDFFGPTNPLVSGDRIVLAIPPTAGAASGNPLGRPYLVFQIYALGTTPYSTRGTYSARITTDPQTGPKIYPNGNA